MSEIRKEVDRKIVEGRSSREIIDSFDSSEDKEEAEYWIQNTASFADRKRFLPINIILSVLLGFVTLKKIAVLFSLNGFDPLLLFSLVVPCINIYLLREILKFRRMGYQVLAILSIISLVNAENRELPELVVMPCIAALSFFLYWRMFRK